jgi:hypothetical protein
MAFRLRLGLGAILALALAGAAGYWVWTSSAKDRVIAEQRRVITELEGKLDRAWATELVGDLRIESVTVEPPEVVATFYQYAPGTETPVVKRRLRLAGTEVYVDALVVTFERKYVEAGDGLRGKSLLLFRRAFGDRQRPVDGVPLFRTEGAEGASPIPEVAQVDPAPSEFERALWTRFWDYANDPRRAAADGIRIAQGEAPHIKPVPGQVYKLTLRAAGGLEIAPRLPAAVTGAH